mmetsp:Transcript_39812/g.99605  ORF Transcript_39812/g.99605 Transcript_39812/m.99605 type:complete len:254 (-) Transcript_39812:554-1315(-)
MLRTGTRADRQTDRQSRAHETRETPAFFRRIVTYVTNKSGVHSIVRDTQTDTSLKALSIRQSMYGNTHPRRLDSVCAGACHALVHCPRHALSRPDVAALFVFVVRDGVLNILREGQHIPQIHSCLIDGHAILVHEVGLFNDTPRQALAKVLRHGLAAQNAEDIQWNLRGELRSLKAWHANGELPVEELRGVDHLAVHHQLLLARNEAAARRDLNKVGTGDVVSELSSNRPARWEHHCDAISNELGVGDRNLAL